MTHLTRYDIALIGVKLLAIYIALQAINNLPNGVIMLPMMFAHPASDNISAPFLLKLVAGFFVFFPLLASILLWILSGKMAQFITNSPEKISEKNEMQNIDIQAIQAMALCVIGVFVLVTAVPELVAWIYAFIYSFIKTSEFSPSRWPSTTKLIATLLQIIFGLALIFTAKNLSALLYKLRYAGFEK
jgi:hypothetical protein